jgi:dihydrofolate reductase
MNNQRKVILFIAISADGYIAKPGDDISFLSIVEQPDQDYGYGDFIKTVDTVILGRRTYEKILNITDEFPHRNKECFIITNTSRPAEGNITFYNGDLRTLIMRLKATPGNHIFVNGGSMIVNELMKLDLIDEFIISIIPVLLGDGIPLFNDGRPEINLKLVDVRSFNTGLVQLHYIKAKQTE